MLMNLNPEKKMGKGKAVLKDLVKILLVGLVAGLVIFLVLFGAGFLLGKGAVLTGLETAKNGLFVCTSLTLFVVAGMLMIKGKKPEKKPEEDGWRKHFQVIGLKTVIFMLSMSFLFWASLVDYVMLRMSDVMTVFVL